jgi:hypothetical protein
VGEFAGDATFRCCFFWDPTPRFFLSNGATILKNEAQAAADTKYLGGLFLKALKIPFE